MEYSFVDLEKFVRESNYIERIFRDPTKEEINELNRFINLPIITLKELEHFVSIYQPDARLRDEYGLNVRVGKYYPPFGSPQMRSDLQNLLVTNYDAYSLHIQYEKLHPFMDGNGRSGRALWAWKHKNISEGFLLPFYFQSLQYFSQVKENNG